MLTLLDVYGYWGTICGYWGTGGDETYPPWIEVPGLSEISFDKIDRLIMTNYGDRPVSRYVREYVKLGGGHLDPRHEVIIAQYVLDLCRLSWARLTADFAAEYNPVENYLMTEKEGVSDTESGTDTTTRTYTDYKETSKFGHKVTTTDNGNVYGFDNDDLLNPDGAKDDKDVTETVYGAAGDTGDTREVEGSHADSTVYGHKNQRSRNFERRGNIGTLTNVDMLSADTAYWSAENFFDKIAADIAAILTIPIYE